MANTGAGTPANRGARNGQGSSQAPKPRALDRPARGAIEWPCATAPERGWNHVRLHQLLLFNCR